MNMQYFLGALLLVSWVDSMNINFNTSLAETKIHNDKPIPTKMKQGSRMTTDEEINKNQKGIMKDTVYETKYIFNKSPNKEEQARLDIIRDQMRTILGQTQFCNTSNHDYQMIEGSSCIQSCSCDPSCHESQDCCPDIQHKVADVTIHTTQNTTHNQASPKPVCITLHDILSKHDPIQTQKKSQDGQQIATATTAHDPDVNNKDQLRASDDETLKESTFPHYLVIQSCPKSNKNKEFEEKCQQKSPKLILDNIPVIDWFSKKIYRNKDCAACNDIHDTVPWTLVTDCMGLYQTKCPVITIEALIQLTQRQQCNITLRTPAVEMEQQLPKCRHNSEHNVIGSCNHTGLWTQFDKLTHDLCVQPDMITRFLDKSVAATNVYKNMFCFLCNQPTHRRTKQQLCSSNGTTTTTTNEDAIFPDFEVILDNDMFIESKIPPLSCGTRQTNGYSVTNSTNGPDNCRQDEVWDVYKNKCRELLCPLYQMAYQQLCIPKQALVKGLVISTQVLVTLPADKFIIVDANHGSNQRDSFDKTKSSPRNLVKNATTNSLSIVFREVYQTIKTNLQFEMYHCEIKHVEALANAQENQIKYFILKMKVENNYRCSVEVLVKIFEGIASDMKTLSSPDILQVYNIPTINVGLEYHTLPLDNFNIKQILLDTKHNTDKQVTLEPLFYCPRIQLTLDEYRQSIKQGIIEDLNDHDFDLQFSAQTQTTDVCLLTYIRQWLDNKYKAAFLADNKNTSSVGSTLSMIATMTSIISTVIVLVTYSIFSELRFIPGKLFMILCINLLLAQFFFACGSNTGYSDFWCKVVGIGIHYFWLATIFSMSSCLSLMIHSVKSPMEHNNRVIMQSKSICKAMNYILVTYLAPLLLVITNLVLASARHSPYGGYGGAFCYISTNTLRIYTFAVPVGIVICVNFTMFAMIFTNLVLVIKSNQKSNHQYVLVFLKLTTITGMFWTFGFLYEATQIIYFAYLFTILNAGQGFFLMWSFIMNKRVMNLYINKIMKYYHTYHETWNLSGSTGQNSK